MRRSSGQFVLLVTNTPALSPVLEHAIEQSGMEVVVVRTFHDARVRLADQPAVVITELKLGPYNGLHLALHAAAADIPTIVVADSAFKREVDQLGARWLAPEAAGDELPALIAQLSSTAAPSVLGFPWHAVETRMNKRPELTLWRIDGPHTTH